MNGITIKRHVEKFKNELIVDRRSLLIPVEDIAHLLMLYYTCQFTTHSIANSENILRSLYHNESEGRALAFYNVSGIQGGQCPPGPSHLSTSLWIDSSDKYIWGEHAMRHLTSRCKGFNTGAVHYKPNLWFYKMGNILMCDYLWKYGNWNILPMTGDTVFRLFSLYLQKVPSAYDPYEIYDTKFIDLIFNKEIRKKWLKVSCTIL